MHTDLENVPKVEVLLIDSNQRIFERPRPFVVHPEVNQMNVLFYLLVGLGLSLILYTESPSWLFPIQIGFAFIYGSIALNIWRKHPVNKVHIPRWLGRISLRLVRSIVIPSVWFAGSVLILVYFSMFSGLDVFWKQPWWPHYEQLMKQTAAAVSLIAFLGINFVKASPVLSENEWKKLSLSEWWLTFFLILFCFLEQIITVI